MLWSMALCERVVDKGAPKRHSGSAAEGLMTPYLKLPALPETSLSSMASQACGDEIVYMAALSAGDTRVAPENIQCP